MQVNPGPVSQDGNGQAQAHAASMMGRPYDNKNIAIDSQLLQSAHQDDQAQAALAAAAAHQHSDRSTEYANQQLQGYPGLKPEPDHHHAHAHAQHHGHGAPLHHVPHGDSPQGAGAGVPASLGNVPSGYGTSPGGQVSKPMVGSEEYYRIKKYNHKEVERRRRETINKGIDDLGKVVPDCDKHKGQILARAVDYIKMLKDKEDTLLKQLTLEKLISEQSINELSSTNKSLKAELAQAWKELEHYKRQAERNNEQ